MKIFKLVDKRYRIDGQELQYARRRAGLTAMQCAELCGWSRSYQSALENGSVATVSEATKNVLVSVCKLAGEQTDGARG
jgi:transcriptional regulator with XRE-family HTH domain